MKRPVPLAELPEVKHAVLLQETTPAGVVRKIELVAGYEFLAQGYGRHGAELCFLVSKGPCIVRWQIMTNWMLPESRVELERLHNGPLRGQYRHFEFDGLGEVMLHSSEQLEPAQEIQRRDCEYTGGICYSTGSCTSAREMFDLLVSDPGAVWGRLEARLEDGLEMVRVTKGG